MKINWTVPITNFEGEPLKEGAKTITLGFLACRALDATLPEDKDIKTETKVDRWDLMVRIRNGSDIEKSEVKLIRDRIGQAFSAWIAGTCISLLNEQKPPEASEPKAD